MSLMGNFSVKTKKVETEEFCFPSDQSECGSLEEIEDPSQSSSLGAINKKYLFMRERLQNGFYTDYKTEKIVTLLGRISHIEVDKGSHPVIKKALEQLSVLSRRLCNLYNEDILFHLSLKEVTWTHLTHSINQECSREPYIELQLLQRYLREEGNSIPSNIDVVSPKKAEKKASTIIFLGDELEGSLDIATLDGNRKALQVILQKGNQNSFSRASLEVCFEKSAMQSFVEVVSVLSEKYKSKISEKSTRIALFHSADVGSVPIVKNILSVFGEKISAQDMVKATKRAAKENHVEIVSTLLQEIKAKKGKKELAISDLQKILLLLARFGDAANLRSFLTLFTLQMEGGDALIEASLYNHYEVIEILLSSRNITIKIASIRLALEFICMHGYRKCFSLFSPLFISKKKPIPFQARVKVSSLDLEFIRELRRVAKEFQTEDLFSHLDKKNQNG